LVIDVLVKRRALRIAVEDEHGAEERACDDRVGLIFGAARRERRDQRVAVDLALGDLFNVPLKVFGFWQRVQLRLFYDRRCACRRRLRWSSRAVLLWSTSASRGTRRPRSGRPSTGPFSRHTCRCPWRRSRTPARYGSRGATPQ